MMMMMVDLDQAILCCFENKSCVLLWTITPITRLYIQNLLKSGGSKKSNKLLKHFLHKHKSQWTYTSKWPIQFDYTTLYCVQLTLLWFDINMNLFHHIWIWGLLIWGLLHFFQEYTEDSKMIYGIGRFIIMFRKACQWQLPWVQFIKIHTLILNFSKTNYHAILPSMAWSLKLFLSLGFSDNMQAFLASVFLWLSTVSSLFI